MNFLENIISVLNVTMDTPVMFGAFHIVSLIIMLATIVAVILLCKNTTEKQNKVILISYAVLCLVLEVYKQLILSYREDLDIWKYRWYAFPFQFCSTPMYIALLVAIIKNKKTKQAMYNFLATYSVVGGIGVVFNPNSVFVAFLGINIQTMMHHGLQVVIGIYLIVCGRVKPNFRAVFSAFKVFVVLVFIAISINIGAHYLLPEGTAINMFFINPFYDSGLAVFTWFYGNTPYFVFALSYIFVFTLLALLYVTVVAFLINIISVTKLKTLSKIKK